ncbi:YceK/YidQ family lipoprotein [Pantoea sp. Nvir]|uniref:YceK/YidQ family lipoprotein n=1 Tax=Pantoea sp. Nvir TaxID=2576760 RepID=UPI0013596BB4|nr:YceK/YidQ family lipoprotein [Pantoea sp. Nvir]MXP66268.1 YceK/YidQ family lipoprotein [Pantoea sp. Nvir]
MLIALTLSGYGSIIRRSLTGRGGHGRKYYFGLQCDVHGDGLWRMLTILDLPMFMIVNTMIFPVDAQYGPYL